MGIAFAESRLVPATRNIFREIKGIADKASHEIDGAAGKARDKVNRT